MSDPVILLNQISKLEKKTPGTVVYAGLSDSSPIKKMYIQKFGLEQPYFKRIKITIEGLKD